MVDFSNKHLAKIEEFLTEAVSSNPMLTNADLDPKEIVFQLSEEVRTKQFKWNNNLICVPSVVRVILLEEKAAKIEEVEMLFSAPTFINAMQGYLEENQFHLLTPIRVEVELISKGSSRAMYCAGRCLLTLDWPLAEETEVVDVVVDDVKKQVLEVQERKPQIPLIARLTALNADVYRNSYYITKEITYLGRLRVVRDSDSARFVRRNDFVFAQLEDPKAVNNSVSRQHAKIEFHDNAFFLVDQGSANFTAVERGKTGALNTISVDSKLGTKLENGDIILLGYARIRFNIVDRIDTTAYLLQRDQDVLAKKLEHGAPKQTMKLPSLSEILAGKDLDLE